MMNQQSALHNIYSKDKIFNIHSTQTDGGTLDLISLSLAFIHREHKNKNTKQREKRLAPIQMRQSRDKQKYSLNPTHQFWVQVDWIPAAAVVAGHKRQR